jgi:glutathione S-transferase
MSTSNRRFTLILGNKRYSSWSLRGWLAMRVTGAAFQEIVIPLRRPETSAEIRAYSPSGRVPALIVEAPQGRQVIWDSLAIAEYLAEQFPQAGLWPDQPEARALARSITAEMHSGFAALRSRLPMDLGQRGLGYQDDQALRQDVARICEVWRTCRSDHGTGGDYLFGGFCAADIAFTPVASRFATYGVALDETCAAYRDSLLGHPAMVEWTAASASEPEYPLS